MAAALRFSKTSYSFWTLLVAEFEFAQFVKVEAIGVDMEEEKMIVMIVMIVMMMRRKNT